MELDEKDKKYISKSTGGISSIMLIIMAIAYFVYGGLDGVFGIVIYEVLAGVCVLFGFIPFIGFIITALAITYWISPFVWDFTGLYPTLLTDFIFGFVVVIALIISFVMTLAIFNRR